MPLHTLARRSQPVAEAFQLGEERLQVAARRVPGHLDLAEGRVQPHLHAGRLAPEQLLDQPHAGCAVHTLRIIEELSVLKQAHIDADTRKKE